MRQGMGRNGPASLSVAVRMWPTPTARDGTSGPGHTETAEGSPDLRTTIMWNTPRSSGASLSGGSNSRKTAIRDGSYISGSLNPAWVGLLMGFPEDWTATAGLRLPGRRTPGSRRARSHPEASPTEASA